MTRFLLLLSLPLATCYTVAVFGGSGFVGSRVCQRLSESGARVVSVSRRGGPPARGEGFAWTEGVEWLAAALPDEIPLGEIDAAVSCVGALEAKREFGGFFGLDFDDEALRNDIFGPNEAIINLSAAAGAKRFAFVSCSYETQKALEGAIEGYIDGKRLVERKAYSTFGDRSCAVAPSLVLGGARFPTFLKFWRAFVGGPGKAYVATNDALRSISPSPLEDWVEKMVFSSPSDVEDVASAIAASVVIGIEKGPGVGQVPTRRQGFFGTDGKPVTYVDIPYIDGAQEIQRIASEIGRVSVLKEAIQAFDAANEVKIPSVAKSIATLERKGKDAPFENALVGKKPLLYPIPVALIFGYVFWGVATQQFTQLN